MASQVIYFNNPATINQLSANTQYSATGVGANPLVSTGVAQSVNEGRRAYRINGDLSDMMTRDTELIAIPSLRAAAAITEPNLIPNINTSTQAALCNGSDQYSRLMNEYLIRGANGWADIPGTLLPAQAVGFDWPNGPVPIDHTDLRQAALNNTNKYSAAYFDEVDAGDGRGDTTWENIRALRRYRIMPLNTTSYSGAYGLTGPITKPYPGQAQGQTLSGVQIPPFDLSLQLKLSSTTGAIPLGLTTLNTPNPIYLTPFAAHSYYGPKAHTVTSNQGATDANCVVGQSVLAETSVSALRQACTNNQYYFTTGTLNAGANTVNLAGQKYASSTATGAPFGIFQIYTTADNDINMSIMASAKAAGYSVLMYTVDAGHSHIADRMLQYGSNLPISACAAGCWFNDPVFNYKCYLSRSCVGTTDPNVLAYASSKLSVPIPTLQASYNVNNAWSFLIPSVLNGLRLGNNFKSEADCIANGCGTGAFLWSSYYYAQQAHSTSPISDAWPNATGALPILYKGITNVQDALAVQSNGVDGVVVSNHGGRFYDQSISTLDALEIIYPAVKAVNPNFGVWFDSGIRRGTDVLAAFGKGAEFVGVGRPCQQGAVTAGRVGVRQVLQRLVATIRRHAQIAGLPHLQDYRLNQLILKQTPSPANNFGHGLWN